MKKVLLVIDGQNSFCPGGTLPVSKASIALRNTVVVEERGCFDAVIATKDIHDKEHISFASRWNIDPFTFSKEANQTVWPDHCIKGTNGAELNSILKDIVFDAIVEKGTKIDVDSYSGFFDNDRESTGLEAIVREGTINDADIDIYICGLATDVCVRATALDARDEFENSRITVISDASAATSPEAEEMTLVELSKNGICVIDTETFLQRN